MARNRYYLVVNEVLTKEEIRESGILDVYENSLNVFNNTVYSLYFKRFSFSNETLFSATSLKGRLYVCESVEEFIALARSHALFGADISNLWRKP